MDRLTFLITAGPTREFIDPVRYLSNASSGKMGFALAAAARKRRHRVILVSGPVDITLPKNITVRPVISASEMFSEVKKYLPRADIFISAAAVADYRPQRIRRNKIKKNAGVLNIRLIPTEDILAYAGTCAKKKVIVGFALETRRLLASAQEKLKKKNSDLMVANSPSAIGQDTSRCVIISRRGPVRRVPLCSKNKIAEIIIDEAIRNWKSHAFA